jgi:uncharacterized protein YecE (DUF72 family)
MIAIRVGTAGWSIPKQHAPLFPAEGTHLQRYARVLGAAEINSSFYRPHRRATYERWAASVPAQFRFAVKLPKLISHGLRLRGGEAELVAFLEQVSGLGERLGPILIQLPPTLAFEPAVADAFFSSLRRHHPGDAACEPRHASWFAPEADGLLRAHRVARVAADPPPLLQARDPGGFPELAYFRLHGSPEMYRSPYPDAFLRSIAAALRALPAHTPAYCIFDNTARGAAAPNALALQELLGHAGAR